MKRTLIIFIALLLGMGRGLTAQSVQDDEMDDPEWSLRHDLSILHGDVRKDALIGFQKRFNLTDDELSERLVRLATVTTNGEDATLRMFIVASLSEFGTTNALEFLKNEAVRGGDVAGGVCGFGAIVGFDDSFFTLAEQMLADKSVANSMRRKPVYMTFESLLCSDVYHGRSITPAIRGKATEALKRHALTDTRNRVLIDLILTKNGPEAQSYRKNLTRRHLAELALADASSSDYARNYFGGVLEQMEREAAATNAASIKKPKNEQEHKPTSSLDPKAEQTANGEDVPATNGKARFWRIVLSLLIILMAVLLVAAGVRHRRK